MGVDFLAKVYYFDQPMKTKNLIAMAKSSFLSLCDLNKLSFD